jgi:GNAT superfamily N-acetyltransferase
MITVRKATISDIGCIAEFQMKMALETESLDLDREVINKGVSSLFADPAKGHYLIAESNNEAVACMMLTPEWSDWRNGWFLWIQSLYVLPDFRKKGIFKAMYHHVKSEVLKSGEYMGLRLYVVRTNEKAMAVYSTIGMDGDHYRMYEWVK